jgi:hypothetical protein
MGFLICQGFLTRGLRRLSRIRPDASKRLRLQIVHDEGRLRLVGGANWLAEPLEGLREFARLTGAVDKGIRDTVEHARRAGHTWSEIGGVLGISKQAAWERFSGED